MRKGLREAQVAMNTNLATTNTNTLVSVSTVLEEAIGQTYGWVQACIAETAARARLFALIGKTISLRCKARVISPRMSQAHDIHMDAEAIYGWMVKVSNDDWFLEAVDRRIAKKMMAEFFARASALEEISALNREETTAGDIMSLLVQMTHGFISDCRRKVAGRRYN